MEKNHWSWAEGTEVKWLVQDHDLNYNCDDDSSSESHQAHCCPPSTTTYTCSPNHPGFLWKVIFLDKVSITTSVFVLVFLFLPVFLKLKNWLLVLSFKYFLKQKLKAIPLVCLQNGGEAKAWDWGSLALQKLLLPVDMSGSNLSERLWPCSCGQSSLVLHGYF